MTFRNTADGILWAVDKGCPIQPETLEHLLVLLASKTTYQHHVEVAVLTGAVLKTIDNERDAQETIRLLISRSDVSILDMHPIPDPPIEPKRRAKKGGAPVKVTPESLTDEMIREHIADLDTELAIAWASIKILRGPHRDSCRQAVCDAINARAAQEK